MASGNVPMSDIFLLPSPDEPLLLLQSGRSFTGVAPKEIFESTTYFNDWDEVARPEYSVPTLGSIHSGNIQAYPASENDQIHSGRSEYQLPRDANLLSRALEDSQDSSLSGKAAGRNGAPPPLAALPLPDPERVAVYPVGGAAGRHPVCQNDTRGLIATNSTSRTHSRITRKLIAKKQMDSLVFQFRAQGRDPHQAKASQQPSTLMRRTRKSVVPKGFSYGNRNICMNCHSVGRKCADSLQHPLQHDRTTTLVVTDSLSPMFTGAIRCNGCVEPRFPRQLFCRVRLEELLPVFSMRPPQHGVMAPTTGTDFTGRIFSGDIVQTMGPAFQSDRSDLWFKIPFNHPSAIEEGDVEQVGQIYRANLPILPPVTIMKRQTKMLIGFAESLIQDRTPMFQLIRSAVLMAKLGYYLFHSLSSEKEQAVLDPLSSGPLDRSQRGIELLQAFGRKFSEFMAMLDSSFHKKPTTQGWVTLVTSTALMFDMFQYVFYLLQGGLLEFSISDLRRFRAVLFTRFSMWGGLRLLGQEELLARDSALHKYYRGYTNFWQYFCRRKHHESSKRTVGKETEIGFRYNNGAPLPLPLHLVQTGDCRTAGNHPCGERRDRAMCSGCFMRIVAV